MIHIFYLAAGQSRRYGAENKLLANFGGKPLYRHGLDVILDAVRERNDCAVYIVTCWDDIAEGAKTLSDTVKIVWSADSYLGISYTIKSAIRATEPIDTGDYMVFATSDQPYLTANSIKRLLDAAYLSPCTACLSCDGESGNPVMFSSALKDELCALTGDCGGKRVMRRHPENHIDIQCTPHELYDIDCKEDDGEELFLKKSSSADFRRNSAPLIQKTL